MQRTQTVLLLQGTHRRQVLGVFQARSPKHHDDFGFTAQHGLDAVRCRALPAGSDDQVIPRIATGAEHADIGKVVGVLVDQLKHVIALVIDRRHAQHLGFAAQVEPGPGVRRVVVRRDDVAVVRGKQLAVMTKAVEAADVLRRGRVERLFFHGLVMHEHGVGVNPRFFGNLPQVIGIGGQQPAWKHQAAAQYPHAAQHPAATENQVHDSILVIVGN
ncbi:hypothetical protein D3C86_1428570 [compost metagenome]